MNGRPRWTCPDRIFSGYIPFGVTLMSLGPDRCKFVLNLSNDNEFQGLLAVRLCRLFLRLFAFNNITNFSTAMKKMIFAALMLLSLVSMNINGENCLSMGSDIRISPNRLNGYSQHVVVMHNEAFCDSWSMSVSYPEGITVKLVAGVTPLDGMSVPYLNRYGEEQLYTCPLNVSAKYATISSEITTNGYWDYDGDGLFDPYGTVKWSAGSHSMFEFNFFVDPGFREGDVTFDGRITSGSDQRGAILQDVRFFRRAHLWIGYMKGDVNGDERVNITDIMLIINFIAGSDTDLDEFQVKAADWNSDGEVNISDAVALITHVRNN